MEIDFWKSRRVFITGHTGFKGSWLAFWLISMGADVCGFGLEPASKPNLYEALKLNRELKSTIADVRNLESVDAAMHNFKPDVVIHMAAQSLVRFSYRNPVETYATNVMGTVHVLNTVRQTPSVRAVVCVTSDKCYENREWVWPYREDEAMGGYDPYSSSKGCAELITAAYRRSFFDPNQFAMHQVAVGSGRAGNVIGGGDWSEDRLIPDIVRAFEKGDIATIRNPDAIRPWQHVLEPLSGYLTLAERLWRDGSAFGDAWNFGPFDSDARPVRYVVSTMSKLWGDKASWQVAEEEKLHEAHLLRLDSSKARTKLGWRPRWTLENALEKTAQWYRAYYDGQDARSQTASQIKDYISSKPSN